MAVITGSFNSLVAGTISGVFQNTAGGVLSGVIGTPGPQGIPGPQGPSGQNAIWGDITGTLSDQTDLQGELDGKLSLTGGTLTNSLYTAALTVLGNQFVVNQTLGGYGTYINPEGNIHVVTAAGQFIINPDEGLTFPDSSTQTTAFTGSAATAWGSITGTLSSQTDLQGELDDKLPLAGGAMNTGAEVTISDGSSHDSALAGWGLGVELSSDHAQGTTVEYNGLNVYDSAGTMEVTPTGLTFPDSTVQTTAFLGFNNAALTGNPTAPTPATSDNDTSIATTAYVKAQAFGDRYLTTSTTSNTISNGNKTFTIGTGLSYTPTQNITISYDASHHMHGEVLTYSTSTGVLTVDVNNHTGSGTYASWVVNVGGVTPATSVAFSDITGAVSGNTNLQAALDLKANMASPSLTGTPLSTTASVSTNTTQIATTAFVLGQVGTATPIVNGTAAVGTSLLYSRQDHVHPTDTTRAPTASPSLTGTPLSTTASVDTNTTQIATTAFVRDYISDTTWSVPPITTTTTATSGTGAAYVNASPDYGYLWGPNVNTAGYCQKNILMFARSNSTYGFNFTKEIRISCKMATGWSSTFVATSLTLLFRMNTGTTNGTLSQIGFGISINLATKVLSILAHNGTTLTTKTTSWAVPYAGIASVDFMIKSDGTGTVYAYADGVLIDSTTGFSTASNSGAVTAGYAAVEINSAGGTSSPAQATAYVSNLRTLVAHG